MDEVLELWPADARDMDEPRRLVFGERAKFWWKTTLLAMTTLLVVPILAWQHEAAATLYLAFLVAVHVAGIAVFAWGLRRDHLAPTRRGLWIRIGGLVFFVTMLAWVAKGLQAGLASWLFWVSLFGVWAVHTAALLLMHVRTRGEIAACPFVD